MKKIIAITILVIGLFLASKANAEYCWMVGCEGMAGHIFITDVQKWTEPKETIVINDIEHIITNPESQFIFKDIAGLPEVGAVVELNITTPLYQEFNGELERRKEVFKELKSGLDKPYIGIGDAWKVGIAYASTDDGDFPMLKRTIVEILGYDTFTIDGEDYLFVRVGIIKDAFEKPRIN